MGGELSGLKRGQPKHLDLLRSTPVSLAPHRSDLRLSSRAAFCCSPRLPGIGEPQQVAETFELPPSEGAAPLRKVCV